MLNQIWFLTFSCLLVTGSLNGVNFGGPYHINTGSTSQTAGIVDAQVVIEDQPGPGALRLGRHHYNSNSQQPHLTPFVRDAILPSHTPDFGITPAMSVHHSYHGSPLSGFISSSGSSPHFQNTSIDMLRFSESTLNSGLSALSPYVPEPSPSALTEIDLDFWSSVVAGATPQSFQSQAASTTVENAGPSATPGPRTAVTPPPPILSSYTGIHNPGDSPGNAHLSSPRRIMPSHLLNRLTFQPPTHNVAMHHFQARVGHDTGASRVCTLPSTSPTTRGILTTDILKEPLQVLGAALPGGQVNTTVVCPPGVLCPLWPHSYYG